MIGDFLKERALGPATMEGRAVELWAEVVGDYVAKHTEDVYIRKGIIYVNFSSAAVRTEIFMRRKLIVAQLNARIRAKVVRTIVVR